MTRARVVLATLLAATPLGSYALDLTVQAGYEAEYTNNTALTPTDEDSEWIQTPQIVLGLNHEGPSVTAVAGYNFSRQIHQSDVYNDQNYTVGNALVTWRAIADRLSFTAANASTLTTINSQLANVPSNQQVTNTTTLGSTLNLDGPSNHEIHLHYGYEFSNAEDTDTDSRRQTVDLNYVIPLSPRSRVQLNGSFGHVDYDNDLYSDYNSKSGNLEYAVQGDLIELDTSVGYTVFDREDQDDVDGVTGNVDVVWHLSSTTHANAGFSRSIQDQSDNIRAGIPQFGETFNDNSGITTPYTLDAYTLGLTTELGHNEITLTGHINDQNYDGSDPGQNVQDQDSKGVVLGIGRALRQTVHAQLYATYTNTNFHDGDRQKFYGTGLRIDWNRWRNLTLSTATAYQKQDSDQEANEYTEWTGTITVMYTLYGNTPRR
jgi:hypothetical protein